MKRIIAVVAICAMMMSACASSGNNKNGGNASNNEDKKRVEISATPIIDIPEEEMGDDAIFEYKAEFDSLDDKELLSYVEDSIYIDLLNNLDSADYLVERVSAVYVSKEYLEELAFNSKTNVFFGYSLDELDQQFSGTRYVFTLGLSGTTIVEPFSQYDDTYEKVIKNVAIGTGVILVCVTVSVVSGGVGAPAVSMIFAASAKTGTAMALSSGALGGVAAGIATGIQTKDMDAALKAAALAGSESFKWGAISGAIAGGASKAISLKGATLNGLSMNEAAVIQKESGYPIDVIKQIHNMDEYEALKVANLKPQMINGKIALVRSDIDLNLVDEFGRTNLQRMKLGLAPKDAMGKSYELHHIGQEADATLAILSEAEHNSSALHGFKDVSVIDRPEFNKIKAKFWKSMAKLMEEMV